MITVTKLNEQEIVVNCDMIEWIEATPDTTLSMITGRRVFVRETVDEVLRRIHEYRHSFHPHGK